MSEYGSADNPEQRWHHAYSPYHRVAESDTRVDPLHAHKMAARMEHAAHPDRPTLLRIEGKAGHGAGKPISKRIDEAAYVYAFLFWQLGV